VVRGGTVAPVDATDPAPAVPRRTVLAAAAGLGASACGAPAAGPAPTPAPPPPDPCARAFARTTDIPVGGGRIFPDVPVIVTQPTPGEFRGFGVVCTHDGCQLTSVADGTINCPCHGSRFAITDGSVVRGPARSGLRKERLAVDGGCIVLL
jgi:nitrite reductase/ring-hydroxylating ferredoxin subunit